MIACADTAPALLTRCCVTARVCPQTSSNSPRGWTCPRTRRSRRVGPRRLSSRTRFCSCPRSRSRRRPSRSHVSAVRRSSHKARRTSTSSRVRWPRSSRPGQGRAFSGDCCASFIPTGPREGFPSPRPASDLSHPTYPPAYPSAGQRLPLPAFGLAWRRYLVYKLGTSSFWTPRNIPFVFPPSSSCLSVHCASSPPATVRTVALLTTLRLRHLGRSVT